MGLEAAGQQAVLLKAAAVALALAPVHASGALLPYCPSHAAPVACVPHCTALHCLLAADFYYELGVQVVEACITSRPFTGGLMELSLVLRYVQVRRGGVGAGRCGGQTSGWRAGRTG